MIIDVHYHLFPAAPEALIDELVGWLVKAAKFVQNPDTPSLKKKAAETWADPDGSRLIAGMDEEGVDFTLICAVDNSDNELMTTDAIVMYNKMVADIAKKYPDGVAALAGVDPRRPEAPDLLLRCMDEFGMKGLKYHPDHGYDPGGPESYKLLEIVQAREGILLTHTGALPPPYRSKFAEPSMLSDIPVDFPDLKIIAAHMNFLNWRPWVALAGVHENFHGDIAGWDLLAKLNYPLFCRELRDILDFVGAEKVLLGTDDPVFRIIRSTREWIQDIKDLPHKAPKGIVFTEEETDAMLGGNAARLLGLNKT